MTPAGIEPATIRFVARHFNHCATAVPHQTSTCGIFYTKAFCTIAGRRHITHHTPHTTHTHTCALYQHNSSHDVICPMSVSLSRQPELSLKVMAFTLNISNRCLTSVSYRKVVFTDAVDCIRSYEVGDEWISVEHWWDGADRGKRSTGRKTCFSSTASTTNPTCASLG